MSNSLTVSKNSAYDFPGRKGLVDFLFYQRSGVPPLGGLLFILVEYETPISLVTSDYMT